MVDDQLRKTGHVDVEPLAVNSALRYASLGEVIERNRHVRAIREATFEPAGLPRDPIGGTACAKTIVVVDDEPDLVELTVMILEAAGHRVYGATQGEMGLQLVLEHTPHLLLVDFMMPGMSGGELSNAVRSHVPRLATKIVMASGTAEAMVRAQFRSFDLFLKKPVHPDQLLNIVKDLCT